MSQSTITVMDAASAAFSIPLVSLVIASLIVVTGVAISRRDAPGRTGPRASDSASLTTHAKYGREHRALAFAAIGVIGAVLIANILDGYVFNLVDVVAWWRYTTPLVAGTLSLIIVIGLIVGRGTTAPVVPVLPAARRTWLSFGPRWGLAAMGATALVLLVTTLAAGTASSADDRGRYIWLEIPVPNEPGIDAIRPWFFGWAYGVPVLVAAAVLIAASWSLLHVNAARPYIRPETVGAERHSRTRVAAGGVRIATAGMLLTLAGAWRLIADSGSISLVVDGENGGRPYEAAWRHAEFAVAAGWCAPILEIAAFVLLLLVVQNLGPARQVDRSSRRVGAPADAGSAR